MKLLSVVTISLATALSSFADEIKVRGAEWNDLSNAFNIAPFYIEVQSSTVCHKISLVLEVFQKGKLVKTYESGEVSSSQPSAIDLKSALFFRSKDDSSGYSVAWTLAWNHTSAITRFTVPKSTVDLGGKVFGANDPSISESPKSLLLTIVCNSKAGYALAETLEGTIEANKTATILAVFLKRE